jgi:hypothetical protein
MGFTESLGPVANIGSYNFQTTEMDKDFFFGPISNRVAN